MRQTAGAMPLRQVRPIFLETKETSMTDDTDRPAGGDGAAAPKPAKIILPAPKKGFDPASLKGGKHPGGKPLRGGKMTLPGKSRGRG